MRFVQWLMFHRSAGRRIDDNTTVIGSEWYQGEDPDTLDFRGGTYGRFLWTANGVEYSRQYLPTALANLESPPELILAHMDYVGIDKAVIQTGHTYGRLNDYISDAIHKFPDRFWGLAMVDEWRIDQPDQRRELDRAIDELNLHGLFFNTGGISRQGRKEMVDDAAFYPFWNRVRELSIPVFWNITSDLRGNEGYMQGQAAFGRWLERYPDIPSVCTHGIPLYRFIDANGKVSIPEEAWKPLQAPNVVTEILMPILQGHVWEYLFTEGREMVREYYDRLGPDHLSWGSDLPSVERFCTYR
jgi:predicted TIM-barrel fold metal-dependent hydrolase